MPSDVEDFKKNLFIGALGGFLFILILKLSLWIGLLWVAVHFIRKWW